MKPNYLTELIDRASAAAGSDAALARELDIGRSLVSDWRKGSKSCSPADQTLMAAMAGLDADAWAARAVIEQHRGTAKGAKLEAVLKKALVLTGVALASSSAQAAPAISAIAETLANLPLVLYTMYIMLTSVAVYSVNSRNAN